MNVFAALIDLIIPRECHVCGIKLLDNEQFVCNSCQDKLPVTGYEKYWANKTSVNSDLNPMEQRFAGQIPLHHACAPFFYTRDSSLATLIHDFKYRGFSNLAIALGRLGAARLKDTGFFNDIDVLLPVPLHWTKKLRRGYNQTEMIARGISEATGLPVSPNLKARKPHRTQTSLTSRQRIDNTKGIFTLQNPETLEGKNVMVVDDICTTGATLLSASETIASALRHNVRISLFTLGVV